MKDDSNGEKATEKKSTTRTRKATKITPKNKALTYKGLPLARLGNTTYYGDPAEKYIIKLVSLESEPKEDLELATKVSVELLSSSNHNVCKKISEKNSFYHALDLGQIWLKRILNE
ncbi:MAG: hypothetical protein LBJ38_03700 [Oscillospiraceae bacterium]|jgi:hypothetical protein|nr:hypothetical protein [Oscillospiraceae bacterium]